MNTNTELLNAMPFDEDYIDALRDVLDSIAVNGAHDGHRDNLENVIERSTGVIRAMIDFLKAETPISEEELLRTIDLLSSKDKIEALDKDDLISREGVEIYDCVQRLYQSKNVYRGDILTSITNRSVKDMAPYDKEIFYFHLSSNVTTLPLVSDLDRFAKRCNIYVAKEVLDELSRHWKATKSPLGQMTTLLKRAPNHDTEAPDQIDKYAAELGLAIRMLGAHDATTLLSIFDSVYARLAIMPRHIMCDYGSALPLCSEKENPVDTAIFASFTSGQAGLSAVLNEVKYACKYASSKKLPRVLLDLPVGDLIDINNALYKILLVKYDSIEGDGWEYYPTGDFWYSKGEA